MATSTLAVALLMTLAACSSNTQPSAAVVRSRYTKIVLGIDHNELQFEHNLNGLEHGSSASSTLPSRTKLAGALQPLYAGVSKGIVSLSELPVPKRADANLGHLLSALSGVSTDMRELVATWPDFEVLGDQLKLDVERVNIFSDLVSTNLRT